MQCGTCYQHLSWRKNPRDREISPLKQHYDIMEKRHPGLWISQSSYSSACISPAFWGSLHYSFVLSQRDSFWFCFWQFVLISPEKLRISFPQSFECAKFNQPNHYSTLLCWQEGSNEKGARLTEFHGPFLLCSLHSQRYSYPLGMNIIWRTGIFIWWSQWCKNVGHNWVMEFFVISFAHTVFGSILITGFCLPFCYCCCTPPLQKKSAAGTLKKTIQMIWL